MNDKVTEYKTVKQTKYEIIFALLITIILSLFTFALLLYSDVFSYKEVFRLATIAYFWIVISWYRLFRTYFNSYTIFIVATYIFYFGQYLLITAGVPLTSGITIVTTYSENDNNFIALFILASILMIHVGALFGAVCDKKNGNIIKYGESIQIQEERAYEIKSLKCVSIIMLLISYVPTIYILYNFIKIVFSTGYGGVFKSELYTSGGFDNLLGFLSTFIIPALIASIIAFRKSKYLFIIYTLTGIYLVMYFLSGSRYNAVLIILAILLIKKYYMGGIQGKERIKYFIGGLVLATLLSLISAIRSELYRVTSYRMLLANVQGSLYENNIIFELLREFGFTFVATATVFMNCPFPISHVYGETYIASIARIFPNLFWDVHPAAKVSVDSVFKSFVTSYGGIGSSFIAEAYYNFGYYSVLLMPFIGWLLYKLFTSIIKASMENDVGKGFLTIYIFSFTLFFIRSDSTPFWRNLIYYGLVPYNMYIILKNTVYRRKS